MRRLFFLLFLLLPALAVAGTETPTTYAERTDVIPIWRATNGNYYHVDLAKVVALISKSDVGLSYVDNIKNRYGAVTDPGPTADSSIGYGFGSLWIKTDGSIWVCQDPAAGAAQWVQASGKPIDYDTLDNKPPLGTASDKNVPASGNAATTEVVMGSDTRLSDARTPTTHASSHTTGADAIPGAVSGGTSGLMTGADKQKLDGIAAGAEVNVNPDWNAASGDAQILNKPPLGSAASKDTGTAIGNVPLLQDDGSGNASLGIAGIDLPTGADYKVNGTALDVGDLTDTGGLLGGGGLPDQTGNGGKYLTTDGSTVSWGTIATTDDQTAAEVSYDNATSGMTATDTQGAIDELKTEIAALIVLMEAAGIDATGPSLTRVAPVDLVSSGTLDSLSLDYTVTDATGVASVTWAIDGGATTPLSAAGDSYTGTASGFTPNVAQTVSIVATDSSTGANISTDTLTYTYQTPVLAFSGDSGAFGTVDVGSTSTAQTFTLTNSGLAASPTLSTSFTGDTTQFDPTDGCDGQTLAPAGTCDISVTYSPDAAAAHSASLDVGGQSVALSGTGAAVPLSFIGSPGNTETFESGAEGSFATSEFTQTDPDGVILTYSATAAKNGSAGVLFANGSSAELTNYIKADLGAGEASYSLSWWFYAPATSSIYSNYVLFRARTSDFPDGSSTLDAAYLIFDNDFTNWRINAYAFAGSSGSQLDTSINLSYGAWYKITISRTNNTVGGMTIAIHNASEVLLDTLTVDTTDGLTRYLYWFDMQTGNDSYLDDIQYDATNP